MAYLYQQTYDGRGQIEIGHLAVLALILQDRMLLPLPVVIADGYPVLMHDGDREGPVESPAAEVVPDVADVHDHDHDLDHDEEEA